MVKMLNTGEKIEERDQKLLTETFEDTLSEGIIVWGKVNSSLVGQTYSVINNGIIRRLEDG